MTRDVFFEPGGSRRLMAMPELRMEPGALNYLLPVYRWHWTKVLPDRKGQLLVVLARGTMNSCEVEFLSDGFRAITSRNALRRAFAGRSPTVGQNSV